jgi:hypothetical protein
MILLSNNPLTIEWAEKNPRVRIIQVAGDATNVLGDARKYVHRYWRLLTDPGAGRDKHRRNPYLSVWLAGPERTVHLYSLQLLESLLLQESRSGGQLAPGQWQLDFQRLDTELAIGYFTRLREGSEGSA